LPEVLIRIAWLNRKLGMLDEAARYAERAVDLTSAETPSTSKSRADALHALGVISYRGNNYSIAADSLSQAARLYELLDEWRSAADARSGASLALHQLGRYDDALEEARKAVSDDDLRPSGHLQRAELLGKLASRLMFAGDSVEANGVFHQALATLGGPSPETASVRAQLLHNQAGLESRLGQYDKAEQLLEQALQLASFSDAEKRIALNSLGSAYRAQGKQFQAEAILRRVIEDSTDDRQGDQVLATSLHNLAMVYIDRGDYDIAEDLLRKSIGLVESLSDYPTAKLGVAIASMGIVHEMREDFAAARLAYERALDILTNTAGPDSSEYVDVLRHLSSLSQDEGKLEAAEDLASTALAKSRSLYGENHPDVADGLYRIGNVMEAKGDVNEAEQAYRNAVRIARIFPTRFKVVYIKALSDVLNQQERYAEARELESELAAAERETSEGSDPSGGEE
jgi:tetratricopeptide (TPR) repeat protein